MCFRSFIVSVVILITSSISAFADTYECGMDSLKVSFQVLVEDTKVDGVEMATFQVKTLNENGDLTSQISGLASVRENFENNQIVIKSYILGDTSELKLITLDSQIKFVKKSSVSSGALIIDCTTKP